ncbi:MAG: hypothetical protein LRY73_19340 [Bacillus sp. (in: Bacteria)]|nr:hypothetical protein [Bacillus sp. (in: firmicutes)]
MDINKKEELEKWQTELESKRDDILRRKHMIKERIAKLQLRLEIANSLRKDKKDIITEQLTDKMYKYEKELADFNGLHDPQLTEIDSLLEEVAKRLARL